MGKYIIRERREEKRKNQDTNENAIGVRKMQNMGYGTTNKKSTY